MKRAKVPTRDGAETKLGLVRIGDGRAIQTDLGRWRGVGSFGLRVMERESDDEPWTPIPRGQVCLGYYGLKSLSESINAALEAMEADAATMANDRTPRTYR